MAKITYATKSSIVTNDVPVTNQWRDVDANEVKASVNHLYDNLGWERYFDATNTVSNKQSLTALQDNIITIDGATSIVDQSPAIVHNPLWASNKIRAISSGDAYDLRVDFQASIANSEGWFEISINIGGEFGKIVINTFLFPKGPNVAHYYSIAQKIYTGDTFVTNGGQIIIEPSHTMQIWDKSIYIERTFEGR